MSKNQSCANVLKNNFVKNVDIIESEGSEDEFFWIIYFCVYVEYLYTVVNKYDFTYFLLLLPL